MVDRCHYFRRPRRLNARERELLEWALRRDSPGHVGRFLAQIDGLRVVGRDTRRRRGGVWEVFFTRKADEETVGVAFAVGVTGRDPVAVAVYAGRRRGRIVSMEVVENATGRPPVVIEVS